MNFSEYYRKILDDLLTSLKSIVTGYKYAGFNYMRSGLKAVIFLTVVLFAATSEAAERQYLKNRVSAIVSHLRAVDKLSPSELLDLAIGLPLRNKEALSTMLRQIYDPQSPYYHHYLTPEQFTERFGPSDADYEMVINFAETNGLTVKGKHPNRMLVDVEGTVSDIEKTFHVKMRVYRHPTENRTFYAPDTAPSLDLAAPILDISGFDNYEIPHPMNLKLEPAVKKTQATPAAGSGPSGTYLGNDFRAAYAPGVALTGSGQKIGLFELDGYYSQDITSYESEAGLPDVNVTDILIDKATGPDSDVNAIAEVSLDIEMAISMAPGVTNVIVYEGPSSHTTLANVDDVLNRMATDDSAKQLSSSWSWGGGTNSTTDQIFLEYATQGQSFFEASGDSGAYTGTINEPDDDPYITLVGGTTLTTTGPGGSWVSETTWSWFPSQDDASSGGVSTLFSIPSWQQPVSMSSNQGSKTMRNLPDVALTANNVLVIYDKGQSGDFGGTSCAAPLWAGFTALINQRAVASKQSTVGFVNPAIYTIGLGANYNADFHDVTTGNNTNTSSPDKFYATNGYDLCTGWGTPNGTNLIGALTPSASQIAPTLTWTNPAGIVYGTTLGSAQLNASANISGTFAYNPSTGTVLNAGANLLSVVFTPNDTFDYSNATSTVSLVVSSAPLTVTANNDSKVYGQTKSYGSGATAFTSSGLQNGATIGTVTITASGGTAANAAVGAYNLTPSAATGGTFNASNYAITYDNGTLTVSPARVSVSGLVVSNKVYNGTTGGTVNLSGATLVGVLNGDSVSLGGTPVATFNSAGVGNGIAVTVSGLALTGTAAGNYTLTPPTGFTANITAAPLAVSANNQSRIYGATNPVFTVSYSGFVNGDTALTALTGAPMLTTGATTNSPVGNYVITNGVGMLSAANYMFNFTNGVLSVTNALLTVSANNTNKMYGQLVTFAGTEFTVSGLVSTDVVSSATLGSAGAAAAATAGSYAITVTNAEGDLGLTNYLITYEPGALTVNKGTPITQTAPVASVITFGQTLANSTVTGAAFTNLAGVMVTMASANFVLPVIAPLAGTTNVLVYFTPVDTADYYPVTNTVTVTVNKGTPTVQTAPVASAITFGQTLANSTVTGAAFTNLAGVMVTMASTNFVLPVIAPLAGTTNVLVYFTPVDTADYYPVTNTVTLTVNKGTPTVQTAPVASAITFGQTVANSTVTGAVFTNLAGVTMAMSGTNFVSPDIAPSAGATNVLVYFTPVDTADYNPVTNTVTVTVNKGIPIVQTSPVASAISYGQTLASSTVTGGVFTNLAGVIVTMAGTNFVSPAIIPSASTTNVLVYFTPVDTADYIPVTNTVTVMVNKAALGVSVSNTNRAYGATNPVFTVSYTGFVNGDDPASLGGTLVVGSGADTNSPVGSYAITASGLTAANYAISYTNGVLSVTNALLTVSANNTNKVYGQSLTFAGTEFTVSGLVSTDFVSNATLNSAGTPATATAGSYAITVTIALGDTGLTNYLITYVPGVLTVGTVQLGVSVNNTNRAYGATNPVFTVSYTGFVNGDGPGSLGGALVLNCGADTNSLVGNYVITASGLTAANYAISYTNGVLSVTNALLTVSANSTNKVYGQSLTFAGTEFTVSGLVSTDYVSSATLNSAGAPATATAGSYAITVTNALGDTGLTNYLITYEPGVLTVGTAQLGVSVNNTNRAYGATNPVFTVSYSGFVNGDTALTALTGAPMLTTGATTNSPVGSYVITNGAGTLSAANYMFNFTNGVLSVTNALLTVSANNVIGIYGQSNWVLTGTVVGLENDDDITAVYNTPATRASPPGNYPIIPDLVDPDDLGTNYQVNLINGVLTIVAPPVFQTVAQQGDTLIFTWSAMAGQTYQVQSETNLTQTNWINLGNVITATNDTVIMFDTNTVASFPQKFYRILLLP
jgi:hypothetical protein